MQTPCHVLPNRLPAISKQILINGALVLSPLKPPLGKVLDQELRLEITQATVIKPMAPLLNSETMHVMVVGAAQIRLKYVAQKQQNQIHAATFDMPFQTLVKWPYGPVPGTPLDVVAHTEYFQIKTIDQHTLLKVLAIRLDIYQK